MRFEAALDRTISAQRLAYSGAFNHITCSSPQMEFAHLSPRIVDSQTLRYTEHRPPMKRLKAPE